MPSDGQMPSKKGGASDSERSACCGYKIGLVAIIHSMKLRSFVGLPARRMREANVGGFDVQALLHIPNPFRPLTFERTDEYPYPAISIAAVADLTPYIIVAPRAASRTESTQEKFRETRASADN
jgi:hypothetical protein